MQRSGGSEYRRTNSTALVKNYLPQGLKPGATPVEKASPVIDVSNSSSGSSQSQCF